MRKITSALAVAAALSASAAHAVEFQATEDTTFSVYGTLEPKLVSEKDANGDSSFELSDEDSTLGFAAEHQLSRAVTGFAQIETEFDIDDGNAFTGLDSAFAGFKGGFGRVQAGNFDNVYEDLIVDATEVAEDAQITDEELSGEDNQIAYYSPDFGGFSFRAQARIQGEDETGIDDGNEVGLAVAGGYTGEVFSLYAGYDDRGAEVVDEFDNTGSVIGSQINDEATYGLAGIVGVGSFEFAAKYAIEDQVDNAPAGDEISFTAIRGSFDYGPGELWASAQEVSPDIGDDRTEVTVGVDHDIYDNVAVFAEAGRFDKRNDEDDVYLVGMIYSF